MGLIFSIGYGFLEDTYLNASAPFINAPYAPLMPSKQGSEALIVFVLLVLFLPWS